MQFLFLGCFSFRLDLNLLLLIRPATHQGKNAVTQTQAVADFIAHVVPVLLFAKVLSVETQIVADRERRAAL